jgi:hypothetical protein
MSDGGDDKPELNGRPVFALSIESQKLIDFLRETAVGQIVGYEEMSDLIGGDAQGSHRFAITTARKHLEMEHIHFGTIRKVGLKRLDVDETLDSGRYDAKKIQRGARKLKHKMARIDYQTPDQRQRGAALQTVARIQESAAKEKSIRMLAAKCDASEDKLLSLRAAFEALRDG